MLGRGHGDHAVDQPLREPVEHAGALHRAERRGPREVEAELHARVGGVHRLTARTGRTAEPPPQLALGDDHRTGHTQGPAIRPFHTLRAKIGVIVPAAASDSEGGRPSWPAVRSFARAAEAHGLDSVWMYDHFFHKPSDGPIDGQLEAWTVVSALAAATERVEIGTLVLCSSFRRRSSPRWPPRPTR